MAETQRDHAIRQAYGNAYAIAHVGASNASGVARTISDTIKALRNAGVSNAEQHVTIRVMVGQLSYLVGVGLGPEIDELREVESTRNVLHELRK